MERRCGWGILGTGRWCDSVGLDYAFEQPRPTLAHGAAAREPAKGP